MPDGGASPVQRPAADLAVYDAIAVPVLLHRGEQILHANPAMLCLLACGLDEVGELAFDAVVAEEDRAGLQTNARACLSPGAGDPPAQTVTLCSRHGVQRRVEWMSRRCAIDGRDTVVVTCQDLSDMQFVQDSLQQLSQMLHQIVEGGPVATFVIGVDHRVIHWNRACERLTGRSAGEMRGSTDAWRAFFAAERPVLADLIVDGASEETLRAAYRGLGQPAADAGEGAWEVEDFYPRLGSEGRWLYFTAVPLRDANGRIVGAIETLQDVTQRRQAEEELRRHRNELEQLVQERSAELRGTLHQLEAFMQNAPVGVARTRGARIEHHNRKMAEILGWTDGRPPQDTGELFCAPEDFAWVRECSTPVLRTGQAWRHEMWLRHRDGRQLWVQLIAYPADVEHIESGAWWLLEDHTEVRLAQDELRSNYDQLKQTLRKLEDAQNQLLQSEKMASIGQLAAGVAHEINNPIGFVSSNLHTLKGYVEQLLALILAYEAADAQPGPDSRAAVARARTEAEIDYLREDLPALMSESEDGLARVKKIVQDLKDFSRLDQSEWQEADLNAGLESTLNVVRHEVKYKAEVRKQLSPLPLVRCLAAQLNQVFMNLIVNASHAIHGHGVITLASGHQDGWVWIEVADTGCGMSAEVQRRIFEPFFTTKPVGSGTGLGLSLSFSIVQKHGGVIRVHSVPGQGSVFRVWVPVAGPALEDKPSTPPELPWVDRSAAAVQGAA
ncbi:ATP-binding protein [Ideonella oryzae]|uniref:histidine kinase n=1 Tax=Ideonella oryzae TaxID=2937441 RepID=A0ABT1BJH0_9BURK|nr:ATP-binding protein [Ideonella oryzae]MCO5976350.1 PAS domain S-box protein [Ideonella oryzae]